MFSSRHKKSLLKFFQGARVLRQVTAIALLFIAITANDELLSDSIIIQRHPHISNNLLIPHSSLDLCVQTPLISVRSSSVLRKPFNLERLQDCVVLDTLRALLHRVAAAATRILLELQMSWQCALLSISRTSTSNDWITSHHCACVNCSATKINTHLCNRHVGELEIISSPPASQTSTFCTPLRFLHMVSFRSLAVCPC